jgi:Mrp family chromosome partitioning ATPase
VNAHAGRTTELESRKRAKRSVAFALTGPTARMAVGLRAAFADLTARARETGPAGRANVVLLTGCGREVGTTSVALALAWIASEECSVLLVDVDTDRAGLSRLTSQKQAIENSEHAVLTIRPSQRLAFLPLRPAVLEMDPALVLRSYREGIGQQRQERDLVILDAGSVFESGGRWASVADSAILVCDKRRSPHGDWSRAWDRLEEAGTSIMGVIETATTFPTYET